MERHHTHLDAELRADLLARLKSVEGHVRGVRRMVEADQYCIDVIKQNVAIQRALDKVNAMLLENHLTGCVTSVIRGHAAEEREEVLGEILEVFETSRKV